MSIKKFIRMESAGGLLLMAAALLALILDNSPLAWLYDKLLELPLVISLGGAGLEKPLLLWINDGLMAIFFLLVGLEIKRELMEGELSTRAKATLPIAAAIGGMLMPALFFVAFNWNSPENMSGWAIPAATDIAFALGILALLGKRVPLSIKVFLTAVAIVDDLGAIMIIALFYTSKLSITSIGLAGMCAVALICLNRFGVKRAIPYMLIGIVMWVCVLKSGVHATLAGVVLALTIPLERARALEHSLHPYVAFLIMPVFAFANAGVPLAGLTLSSIFQPLTIGIAAGLFAGKQLGVYLFARLAVALKLATKPSDATWRHIYGAAILSGVGFTMSLFIGTLAFEGVDKATSVRIGVIMGSLLSGLAGYALLRWSSAPHAKESKTLSIPPNSTSLGDLTS